MEQLEDNYLMNQAKNGNLDSLGLLFERYKNPLFGYFYNTKRDAGLAEDLTHNTFERIIKYRSSFKDDGEFRHWLFHIARNISIDHYRKEGENNFQDIEEQYELKNSEEADSDILKDEREKMILNALNTLPEDKREILILSKVEGMKYKDIAAILNVSEGNVKVRVFRALNEMKELLKNIY